MRESPTSSAGKSTIVRSQQGPLSQRVSLAGVGVLSRLAPTIAARLAERLFLTPPRHRVPERERDLPSRALRTTLRVGGRRIVAWVSGTGPRILLVHGWGGRGAQLGSFVDPLIARGFSVAWFDGPAHGASDGRQVTIPEMATALRAVVDAVGPAQGIVAHSGGAMVTAWAARRWLLEGFVDLPEAIALVAAPADFVRYFEQFARLSGLSESARGQLRHQLEARVGAPLAAFDLRRLVADVPIAALVVHDRDDAEAPWTEGAEVAAAWPAAELVTTRGLGHRRILRDAEVVARVAEFLAGHLAERPWLAREGAAVSALC
jgi:pimeloyl-ACP methyl ester carboxylesterase